jgi:hypothetical protein
MAEPAKPQETLQYSSWRLVISISSLVASLLLLGTSMHDGWKYQHFVVDRG